MAEFDASQITDLAEILGTNSDVLDAHLDYYASVITDSDKTKVLSLVTSWQAVTSYQSIDAKDRNFGVNYSPAAHRNELASRIARLVQFEQGASTGSRLVRA
jgi:hypothetical protein